MIEGDCLQSPFLWPHPMPEFAYPWFLLLLLLLPPLLWHWRRRSRGAVRFSSAALVQRLPSRRANWLRHGGLTAPGLGCAGTVPAPARPASAGGRARVAVWPGPCTS